jgi:uncharacterized ion transporter superfamily protein YfcC
MLAAGLTWIIPAGSYQRVHHENLGSEVIVRGSYQATESAPQTLVDVFQAPVRGLYDAHNGTIEAIDVAIFVLFVGGFIGVVNRTGALEIAMETIVHVFAAREAWLIPVLMSFFALGGSIYGMSEEALPLLALLIPIMLKRGYDTLVPVAIVVLGTTAGRFGSTTNPFFTGVASHAAEIDVFDGIIMRSAMLVAAWATCTWWIMRYARRIRQPVDCASSDQNAEFAQLSGRQNEARLSWRHMLVLVLFVLTIVTLLVGTVLGGWWMTAMSAHFLVCAILVAIAGKVGEREFVESFLDGARDLLGVALIIGLARGILVILRDGHITDTVLYAGETTLSGLAPAVFVTAVLVGEFLMAFLVPSSSGLSMLTIPVLAPMADLAGVSRVHVVTAAQAGASIMHLVSPTVASTMAMIAIGRVPYRQWLWFVAPLLPLLAAIGVAALTLGVMLD